MTFTIPPQRLLNVASATYSSAEASRLGVTIAELGAFSAARIGAVTFYDLLAQVADRLTQRSLELLRHNDSSTEVVARLDLASQIALSFVKFGMRQLQIPQLCEQLVGRDRSLLKGASLGGYIRVAPTGQLELAHLLDLGLVERIKPDADPDMMRVSDSGRLVLRHLGTTR